MGGGIGHRRSTYRTIPKGEQLRNRIIATIVVLGMLMVLALSASGHTNSGLIHQYSTGHDHYTGTINFACTGTLKRVAVTVQPDGYDDYPWNDDIGDLGVQIRDKDTGAIYTKFFYNTHLVSGNTYVVHVNFEDTSRVESIVDDAHSLGATKMIIGCW